MAFSLSLGLVYFVLKSFPPLSSSLSKEFDALLSQRGIVDVIRKPSSKDLQLLKRCVEFYMGDFYWVVVSVLCSVYVFLQAFAIPGPAIIAILMAALFGGWAGGIMSMSCSLFGSSICYSLFRFVGRPILGRFFSKGVSSLRGKLEENKDNIFFFFLFLRVTPILPNWFINISSGNLGITFTTFFFGTLLGLIPNAVILARAGVELATIGDASGASGFDLQRAVSLLGVGLLALLPVVIKMRFKNKLA
jgi:uncharacterized membrane protein YdjX (TVP38/TMEM64 family)